VLAASVIRAIALMMEAVCISWTSVNFYQTTRRNKPEGSHLQSLVLSAFFNLDYVMIRKKDWFISSFMMFYRCSADWSIFIFIVKQGGVCRNVEAFVSRQWKRTKWRVDLGALRMKAVFHCCSNLRGTVALESNPSLILNVTCLFSWELSFVLVLVFTQTAVSC
jgi:hypothetical protein